MFESWKMAPTGSAVPAILFTLLVAGNGGANGNRNHLQYPCESEIYCYGRLLDKVQMEGIYPDSKTFVDMKMKQPPNETLAIFDAMMAKTEQNPTRGDIEVFIEENFDPAGSEFEDWIPRDWKAQPSFLQKIKDPVLRKWASDLNEFWLKLGRKMKHEVKLNQELYSIIYVDNPVIVPGGRFREFYYWDSYWIIRGLLLSEMKSTAKGMLLNFISIIERYGHIPNGGRVYYHRRSQPPLLVPMIKTYVDDTGDISIIRNHIHTLEREFDYWMNEHFVEIEQDGVRYKLARYIDQSRGPRPESYSEDIHTAKVFDTEDKQEEYYAELKAAAESGWDFSTRWFIGPDGTNKGNLTNLKTRSIIPVDLNAFLCWNAELISEFHEKLGNFHKQKLYKDFANRIMEAIDKVLWHEEVGAWLDYDIDNLKPRDYFYTSNIAPLWTNSYDLSRKDYYVSRVMKYLDNTKVDNFAGGIPTTFEHSGEQWDYPNAWPPLQHILVVGLANTGEPSAVRLAAEWANKWVRSNHIAWKQSGAMYEKYDATISGRYGGGGEYRIQVGFGWSNGVIMDFLDMYGDRLSSVNQFITDESIIPVTTEYPTIGNIDDIEMVRAAGHSSSSSIITAVLAVAATLTAGALGYTVYKKRLEHMPKTYSTEGHRLLKHGTDKVYTELKSYPNPALQTERRPFDN